MRSLIASVMLLVAVPGFAAAPESPVSATTSRGAVSGVGLGALVVSLGAVGAGFMSTLTSSNLATVREINFPGAIATEADAQAYRALLDREDASRTFAIASFITAGVLLVTGIVLLVVDRPRAATVVAMGRSGLTLTF